jgi:polysaccharide export outer membrane protein
MNDPDQNVRLAPRDEVRLIYHPRKYSSFGALTRDSEVAIEDDTLSLAGALSRTGGLDNLTANPASVLLFRFERPEVARALGLSPDPALPAVPIVYRLNLKEPAGFFVAQKFEVQADDLIYVPRADFAETRKFFELVNSLTQIGYDVAVARAVP